MDNFQRKKTDRPPEDRPRLRCAKNADPDDHAIATAVIALGHSMHLRVTAEGVETEGQLQFLSENKCNEAQGFYLSRPLPAAAAGAFLRKHRQEMALEECAVACG